MNRFALVMVIGAGVVGIATYAGRRSSSSRYNAAREEADAECRAYRSQPAHLHAAVCHAFDPFEPRALPKRTEAKTLLDAARTKLAAGDVRVAEGFIRRAVALVDEMEQQGTSIATLVAAKTVSDVLDILSEHRELDAASILRGVRLASARHPFETERLDQRWRLAHWNEGSGLVAHRSNGDLADALDADDAAYREMEHALVDLRDLGACKAAAQKRDPQIGEFNLCERMVDAVATVSRLDAAARGPIHAGSRDAP